MLKHFISQHKSSNHKMKIWILLLLVGVAIAAPSVFRDRRNVKDLIDQLLNEAGVNDLLPWIQEKINSDPDSDRLKEFFDREQFGNIKTHLKQCPGFEVLNAKMQLEGIDLEEILDKVKSFVTGAMGRKFQARRPLGEHVNDFIELLDLENIMEIIQKLKGQSDGNMNKIIEFMDSDEAKQIEACMLKSPDFQDLLEELYNEGIHVKKLVEMFRALFGLSTYYNEGRNIKDMLHTLIKESGLAGLLSWVQEMIATDPDVQRIVDFFRGEEWKQLKNELQECPNYQMIKENMKKEGIDIDQVLESVKNFVTGGNSFRFSSRKSLGELLNEVLGKVDIDTLLVLIMDKLENDPDMKKLVNFLEGDDVKAVIECMRQSQQVQNLISNLKDEGIDVIRLVHVLKAIFGED